MSRVFKREDIKNGILRILPEGATEEILFSKGMWSCGQAVNGVSVDYSNDGGVLTNDDLLAIKEFIEEHFRELVKKEV